MRRVRFVLVSDWEIVEDGDLPSLRGREILEARTLPPTPGKKMSRLEFGGGACQIMTAARNFSLNVDDEATLDGRPWMEGRGSYFNTQINFVPVAVSDDDGITWRLLPQHPEYVPGANN